MICVDCNGTGKAKLNAYQDTTCESCKYVPIPEFEGTICMDCEKPIPSGQSCPCYSGQGA